MAMNYYLGVDGGGSQTRAALADAQGHIVAESRGGASNYLETGLEVGKRGLREAVSGALEKAGVERSAVAGVFLGMAGVTCQQDREAVREMWASLGIGETLEPGIDHDIRIAWSGGFGGRPGIALIAGTGSSCYGRLENGLSHQCGGWGSLADDVGSGCWIGRRALEASVRQADGRLPETALKGMVFSWLGLQADEEFMHRVHAVGLSRAELAQLAPEVLKLAAGGDVAAGTLVNEGILGLVELVSVTARILELPGPPVVVSGGLFQDGDFRRRWEAALTETLPGARLVSPLLSPLRGAVLEAMHFSGTPVSESLIKNLAR